MRKAKSLPLFDMLDQPQTTTHCQVDTNPPHELIVNHPPYFQTSRGLVLFADSLKILKDVPDNSVNLVFTSPPYALHFKKEYGNKNQADYVAWFLNFAKEIRRILTDDGSFVVNIGGTWQAGQPTRSIYHYKLVVDLVEQIGFHLAQECFWFNPAKMPVPAEWVTVRRIRVKDSAEYVWWFSKTPWPKANNRNVLKPYSKDMLRLAKRGVKTTTRPSGHNINDSWDKLHSGGSIPPNVIEDELPLDVLKMGNNASNDLYTKKCKEANIKIHPARFPYQLPEFFVKLLTDEGDVVLDPFGGSMTTGQVCESLNRAWIGIDCVQEYLDGAKFRFLNQNPESVESA